MVSISSAEDRVQDCVREQAIWDSKPSSLRYSELVGFLRLLGDTTPHLQQASLAKRLQAYLEAAEVDPSDHREQLPNQAHFLQLFTNFAPDELQTYVSAIDTGPPELDWFFTSIVNSLTDSTDEESTDEESTDEESTDEESTDEERYGAIIE